MIPVEELLTVLEADRVLLSLEPITNRGHDIVRTPFLD